MTRWLWGELPAAGGSAPEGSPYTNKTQALAKPEPFLWLDHAPTPLPCARKAAQGSAGHSLCCEGPSAFIPAKSHTTVAPEASQEPAPSEGCKAKDICRECQQLLTLSAARNTMEKNRRVQLVPSMVAASCRAELALQLRGNHPKHLIWFLLPASTARGALVLILPVCNSPKCLCRGLWPIRGFFWSISCASLSLHLLWAQMARSGLPALLGEQVGEGSSFPSTVIGMMQEHGCTRSSVPCQNGS